jgi:hypothetical protein
MTYILKSLDHEQLGLEFVSIEPLVLKPFCQNKFELPLLTNIVKLTLQLPFEHDNRFQYLPEPCLVQRVFQRLEGIWKTV